MDGKLFDGYDPGSFYDEAVLADGTSRPHYAALIRSLTGFSPHQLVEREQVRDAAFRQAGITFTVYGEGEGIERTFPMDLVPRIIPADEWQHIESGLVQRVTALNLFLDDLYVGDRAAVQDGIVPRWLVTSSEGFQREAFGVSVPHGARCLVAGIDLVRDAEGTYRVLEDNLRNPSGVSYVLENRVAMTRVLPRMFDDHRVRPVDHYGPSLLDALRRVSPSGGDPDPTVVTLTPMGLWAVHQHLVEQGMHVPAPGELADEDIEYVCVRLSGVRAEVAEAELTAWAEARRPADAARELDRFLRRCDDATHRTMALHALEQTGVAGQAVAHHDRRRAADGPAPVQRTSSGPAQAGPDGHGGSAPHPRPALRRDLEPTG